MLKEAFMKKSMLFLFIAILVSQSFVHLHATDMYKAHFLTFTETVISHLETQLNLTREEAVARQLKISLLGEAQLKKAIKDRIPDFNGQWIFFGPNHLGYKEENIGQTITDMYGAFHDPNQPIYQALQDLKSQYNMQNINPYIITQNANFVKKSENIMIRNINDTYPWANYLKMVTPSSWDDPIGPFIAPYPTGYPGSDQNEKYGTLGATLVHKVFEVFEYKGDSLVYFTNTQGNPDSVYFSMGDRDVVDEFAWDNVFDQSGTDLGFQTHPDTLTIKQGLDRNIELYPGWNDLEVGEVLYVGGDHFHNTRILFQDITHLRYHQFDAYKYSETDLGAYAVAINDIDDAFAMDYILVQFVPEIEYPSIDQSTLPTDVTSGDTFTISLKGDYDRMTSWIPEFQVSGIEYKIVSQTNHSVTVKALTGGQATITVHHNSLLVLDDDSVEVSVGTSSVEDYITEDSEISMFPNPTTDYLNIKFNLRDFYTVDFQITDIIGIVRNEMNAKGTEISVSLPVHELPAGIYFLQIHIDGQTTSKKFIKN